MNAKALITEFVEMRKEVEKRIAKQKCENPSNLDGQMVLKARRKAIQDCIAMVTRTERVQAS